MELSHTKRRRPRELGALAAAIGLSACAALPAFANTWVPTAGGNYDYNTPSNWNPASVPGLADTANFQIDITGDQTINVSSPASLTQLLLGDNLTTASVYNSQILTGAALTFSSTSALISSQYVANSIANPIVLTAASGTSGLTIEANYAPLTFTGAISGSAGVTYATDNNVIYLSNSNTYTGPTTVLHTIVVTSGPNSLGNGTAPATVTIQSTGVYRFGAAFDEPHNFSIGNQGAQFDTNGFDSTISGAITAPSSSNQFVKTGAGTLTLTNTGNTAAIYLQAGSMRVTSSGNLGSPIFHFQGGTLQLAAPITDSHEFQVVTAGTIDTAGFDSTLTGKLTSSGTGSLTKTGLGSLTLTNSDNSPASITVTAGTLRISSGSALGSSLTLDGGTLQPMSTTSMSRLKIGSNGGTIDLSLGHLTVSSTNTFTGSLSLTGSGTLTFMNGTGIVDPGASVNVSPSCTLALAGSRDPFFDGDAVNVNNNSSFVPLGFSIADGTKNVGNIQGSGSTAVSSAATLIANHVRQGNLTLFDTSSARIRAGQGNSGTSLLSDVPNIVSAGRFDLSDSKLIVQFGTSPSPLGAARTAIIKGRGGTDFGNASWNGAGGITSSAAAPGGIGDGTNAGDGVSFAIGYVENSSLPALGLPSYTEFGGQTVDSSSLLIRFTRGADCNLDGKVNSDDVTIVGALFNTAGTDQWFLGDFDYDGISDGDDATVLGALYDATAPALSSAQLTAQFGSEFAAAFERGRTTGVPEPTAVSVLSLMGLSLLMPRRKRLTNARSGVVYLPSCERTHP